MKSLVIKIAIIMALLYCFLMFLDYITKVKYRKEQYGEYIIDFERTSKEIFEYDTLSFSDLRIVFKDDMTFKINKKVPFILDTIGTWECPTFNDDWACIIYRKKRNSFAVKDQISPCCPPDSTIYINGVTPDEGGIHILKKLYFKKLHNNE